MSSGISFPPNLSFKEFLSHTFPGFFLALSVFMLLDVLSPKDLTSWAFGTLTDFLSAMAFIVLLGTILGILIDGIQHWIEENIFVTCQRYQNDVAGRANGIYPPGLGVRHYYYYKRIGGDAFEHLTDNYYRYAEFYGNIFISLIAFSFIAPFYFCYILEIPWNGSIFWGWAVPLILAGFCIMSSYTTFVKYHSHRIDMILESLEYIKFIKVTSGKESVNVPQWANITAQLKELKLAGLENGDLEKLQGKDSEDLLKELRKIKVWKASDLPIGEVKIRFETTLGGLKVSPHPVVCDDMVKKEIEKKSAGNGEATVWLIPDRSGTATVTASAEGFISGRVHVKVNKDP